MHASIIHPEAKLDPSVEVGPFCYIEKGVVLGPGCKLASHVILREGTHLEAHVSVDSFSVLGGLPQDLGFKKSFKSFVYIDAGTCIREGVTIHRSKYEDKTTYVGKHCYLMAQSHVGHDCVVKDHVVLTNNVLLGGHVEVAKGVNIGGNTSIHQFLRIGEGAMIGGFSAFTKDVPPFCLVAERNRLAGLNLVGLKRAGITSKTVQELKQAYTLVFAKTGTSLLDKAQTLLASGHYVSPEVKTFLDFFQPSKKGILTPDL